MPRSLSFPSPFSLVFPSHIFLFPVVFFSLFSVLFFFPYERIISSGRGRGFHPLRLGPFPFLSFSHLSSLLISFYSLLFFYFFFVLFFFPYERIISSGRGRKFHPLYLGPFPFLRFSHLSSLLISFYSLLFFYLFFPSYSSSPMSASFPRDRVGNFALCASFTFPSRLFPWS